MIQYLGNKGMRERHWEELNRKIGFVVEPQDDESLTDLLEKGVSFVVTFFLARPSRGGHWLSIRAFSFDMLWLSMQLENYLPEIKRVSELATQEYRIEKRLEEVVFRQTFLVSLPCQASATSDDLMAIL